MTVRPAIEIDGLSIRFGHYTALSDISVFIPAGTYVTVIGPNGAGKSTLFKAMLGLIPPTEGTIKMLGKYPGNLPPGKIGYVPQIKTLDRSFPSHAIELVVSGLTHRWPGKINSEIYSKAENVLETVGASHLINKTIGKLSGGELQRVYLARALIAEPEIVMLDEPTAGVDTVGEMDMYEHLEHYQAKTSATIMMITHDWHTVCHHCNTVMILNGRQIAYGVPKDVLSEANLKQAFGHVGHKHSLFLWNEP